GKGVSNPIATIWAGAMLLEAVGEKSAAGKVINAIETVLREGKVRTYDLGGNSKTSEVGDAIVSEMKMGG
ncbi:MAG: 3-isopropylmalate dehydrogenase, partial [Proteobacteria bacterium]|nr:3-isopropylmalate dehydrogenase [Pseudomonadota bacterium]